MGETKAPDAENTEDAKPSVPARAPAAAGMPDWARFPLVLAIVGGVSALALGGVYGLTKERIEAAEGRKVEDAYGSILGSKYGRSEVKKTASGEYVELYDPEDGLVAFAVRQKCEGSYNAGDPIQLMVVFDSRLRTVLGVRVIKSKETPGFGERINDRLAPGSIVGMLTGAQKKSRVVVKSSGAIIGIVDKKPDGSVAVTSGSGKTRTVPEADVVSVSEAPFPAAFVDMFTGVSVREARLSSSGGRIDGLTGATVTSRALAGGVSVALETLKAARRSK